MNIKQSRCRLVLFLFAFTLLTLLGLSLSPGSVSAAGGSVDAWTVQSKLYDNYDSYNPIEVEEYTTRSNGYTSFMYRFIYDKVEEDSDYIYSVGELSITLDLIQKNARDQDIVAAANSDFTIKSGYEGTWDLSYDYENMVHVLTNNRPIYANEALYGEIIAVVEISRSSSYLGDTTACTIDLDSGISIGSNNIINDTKLFHYDPMVMYSSTCTKNGTGQRINPDTDLAFISTMSLSEKNDYLWVPFEVKYNLYDGSAYILPDKIRFVERTSLSGDVTYQSKYFLADGTEINTREDGTSGYVFYVDVTDEMKEARSVSFTVFCGYPKTKTDGNNKTITNTISACGQKPGFRDSSNESFSGSVNTSDYKPLEPGRNSLMFGIDDYSWYYDFSLSDTRSSISGAPYNQYYCAARFSYEKHSNEEKVQMGFDFATGKDNTDKTNARKISQMKAGTSAEPEMGYTSVKVFVKEATSDEYQFFKEYTRSNTYNINFSGPSPVSVYFEYSGISDSFRSNIKYAVDVDDDSQETFDDIKDGSYLIEDYVFVRVLDEDGKNTLGQSTAYMDSDIVKQHDEVWGNENLKRLSAYSESPVVGVNYNPELYLEANKQSDGMYKVRSSHRKDRLNIQSQYLDDEFRYLNKLELVFTWTKELGFPSNYSVEWEDYDLKARNGASLFRDSSIEFEERYIEDYSDTESAMIFTYVSPSSEMDIDLWESGNTWHGRSPVYVDHTFEFLVTEQQYRRIGIRYGEIIMTHLMYVNDFPAEYKFNTHDRPYNPPHIDWGYDAGDTRTYSEKDDLVDHNQDGNLDQTYMFTDSNVRITSDPNSFTRGILHTVGPESSLGSFRQEVRPGDDYKYTLDFDIGAKSVSDLDVYFNLEDYETDWNGTYKSIAFNGLPDDANIQLFYSQNRDEKRASESGSWIALTDSVPKENVKSIRAYITPGDGSHTLLSAPAIFSVYVTMSSPSDAEGYVYNKVDLEWHDLNTNTGEPNNKAFLLKSNRVTVKTSGETDLYSVLHKFKSKDGVTDLPKTIIDMTPEDLNKYPNKTTTYSPDIVYQPVQEGNVCWVFNSWDKDSQTINGADVLYIGTWEQKIGYSVAYQFVSGTPERDLPDSVLELLPLDGNIYTTIGENVNAMAPATTVVPDGPGAWHFTTYDKNSLAITDQENLFIGTWVYKDIPFTGVRASAGDWIVCTLLTITAVGGVLLFVKRSKFQDFLTKLKK